MRKSILALATGSTVFALVAAGATVSGFDPTGLPSSVPIVTSTATITNITATCDAAITNVSYELGADEETPAGATSSEIETVTVTFTAGTTCTGDTITATLSDDPYYSTDDVLYSGTFFGTTAVLGADTAATYWAIGSAGSYSAPVDTTIVATD